MRRRISAVGVLLTLAAVVACGSSGARTISIASSLPGTTRTGSTTSTAVAAPATKTAAPATATGDWTQFDFDAQRSGVGPADTGITTANLSRLRLRTVTIDGIADSSAVELHDVTIDGAARDAIFITTSYGKTIAIDPGSGRILWQFDPSGVDSTPGNPQVTTATPIIDPDRRYLYSASPNGYVHKLAVASGRQVWETRVTLDPVHEKLPSSLNISGPYLVVTTGGYIGDIPPYDGHVLTIERSSGAIAHVWNTECSNRHALILASSCAYTNTHGDNAIWGRAGAVIEPGTGRILVSTGNGPFNGSTNWGDSVLELSPDAATLLHNWTPTNQAYLDANDLDLGSASPALLPSFHGDRLAVQAGKAGVLDLLDLNALDGTTGGAGPRLGGQLAQIASPGASVVLTAPAVWSHDGNVYVFVGDDSGTTAYEVVDAAHPRLAVVWQSGTGATSPVIAGGLLYTYNTGGQIDIRSPLSARILAALPTAGGHWNSPIVVGGRIIEPTGAYGTSASSSTIAIYHLPGR